MNLNFRKTALLAGICSVFSLGYAPQLFAVSSTDTVEAVQQTKKIIAVRLNSTTIKIVCSTADFPRSSIFFSFPSPPNQKVMDLEVTPRRISTPFPSPFQDY